MAVLVISSFSGIAAQASVVIDLVQTRFTTVTTGFGDGRPLLFSGQLIVTDEAYARGIAPFVSNDPASGPFRSNREGLLAFQASVRNPDGSLLLLTPLSDFLTPLPPFAPAGYVKNFALALSPAGIGGGIVYNNQESDYRVTLAGDGTFTGTVNTDRGGTCGVGGNCGFSGVVVVSVPEPSGLAAILLGSLVLVQAQRRRAS